MEIFGIGPMELILVLVLALLIFGPDQLPQIGAKLGKSVREMRRATRDFSREVDAARQAIESPMNEIKQPFQDMAQPFQDIKSTAATITQVAQTIKNPAKAIRASVMSELSRTDEPEEERADVMPAQSETKEPLYTEAASENTSSAGQPETGSVQETLSESKPEVRMDSGSEPAHAESAPAAAPDRREGASVYRGASPGGEPTQESAAPSDEPTSQGPSGASAHGQG